MVKHPELQKIFSALETPMRADESINYTALREVVEYQLSTGVEGFYCNGSSGEGLLLSLDERKAVLETVLEQVNGRVPVISHIGTIRAKDVIDLAQHAKAAGANAVSMIPPYYYKFSMDEIMSYYEAVVDAVPGIPAIIYNIPQFTGIEFSKANASRLLENPGIIGVKHTSNNLYAMERMVTAYPDKILFNGFDEQFLSALTAGATATIGTTVNCFAPLFLKVRALFGENRMAEAAAVQSDINHRVEEMCKVGIFNAVKYILTKQGGMDCGSCRAPFKPLSDADKALLDRLL